MERRIWQMPSNQRRATSEPRPGVASRFSNVALRTAVRLIFFGAEDGFIAAHHYGKTNGNGEQDADAAGECSNDSNQTGQDRQSEYLPPVLVDSLPTSLHRG